MKDTDIVTILGCRGSIPVSGTEYARYGGATTCALAEIGGDAVVLDAGSGLMRLPERALEQPALTLLLTHPHLDHMIGLSMCPYLFRQGAKLTVYAVARGGLDERAQVERFLSPPLWPVRPGETEAEVEFRDLPEQFSLGEISVETMEGAHPGGVKVIKLTGGGTSIVFMTDCTITSELRPALLNFARGCGLLLIDGQYSDAEWEQRSGFGHNTWRTAAEFGAECGAGIVRIVHHSPARTDDELDAAAEEIARIHPRCAPAFEGEEIRL